MGTLCLETRFSKQVNNVICEITLLGIGNDNVMGRRQVGSYGVRARECARIRRFIDSEQRVAIDLPGRRIERSLCEKLQVTNETFVRQRGVIEGRSIALGNNRKHVANKLDRDDETVGALRHGR